MAGGVRTSEAPAPGAQRAEKPFGCPAGSGRCYRSRLRSGPGRRDTKGSGVQVLGGQSWTFADRTPLSDGVSSGTGQGQSPRRPVGVGNCRATRCPSLTGWSGQESRVWPITWEQPIADCELSDAQRTQKKGAVVLSYLRKSAKSADQTIRHRRAAARCRAVPVSSRPGGRPSFKFSSGIDLFRRKERRVVSTPGAGAADLDG
jgi:hypothetical protein